MLIEQKEAEGDILHTSAANSTWEELSSSITLAEDGYVKNYVVNKDSVHV